MRIKLKMPKFKVKLKHLRKKYKNPVKGINNETDYGRNEYKDCNQWGDVIKYVHQLQNLYFALTGEELTINC